MVPQGRYIVAGAGGLVGNHALARLADAPGVSVLALYNRRPPAISTSNIRALHCDLIDREIASAAMRDADYLLLFAGVVAPAPVLARDPVGPAVANAQITTRALEAAWLGGIKKVVWLGSTTVYPDVAGDITEDMASNGEPPGHWYAIGSTMRYLETMARAYSSHPARAMPCIVLRPTLIYGAHGRFDDDAHFLPALVRRVVERQNPIEVWGDGEQRRDVVYAADVVDAALLALTRVNGFDVFNIGAGTSVSVNEVLAALLRLDGYTDARIVHRNDRTSTVKARRISIGKARAELGYTPQISLDEGLRRTLAWYRQTNCAN